MKDDYQSDEEISPFTEEMKIREKLKTEGNRNNNNSIIYFLVAIILVLIIYVGSLENTNQETENKILPSPSAPLPPTSPSVVSIADKWNQAFDKQDLTNKPPENSLGMNIIQFDLELELWMDKHGDFNDPSYMARGDPRYKHTVFKAIKLSDKFKQLCPEGIHEFGNGDGGKFYCAKNLAEGKNCVIYSIGSHGDYGFEDNTHKKFPQCQIHTFDCTGDYNAPSYLQSHVTWHKICIGNKKDAERSDNFRTYAQMLNMTISQDDPQIYIPKYFKMDIEGFEFNVFRSMLEDEKVRQYLPEQIAFELHAQTRMDGLTWVDRYKTMIEIYHTLYMLKKIGGYEIIHIDHNEMCGHCSELVIMRDINAAPVLDKDIQFDLADFLRIARL